MDTTLSQHSESSSPASALATLLRNARDAFDAGELPQRPLAACLRALGPVLSFLHDQSALRDEPSLGPDRARAILRLAQELEGPVETPLAVPLPLPVSHEEAIRTGVLLLAAYRAAIEKVAPQPLGDSLVAAFGLRQPVQVRDGDLVAAGLANFLTAAAAQPQLLVAAGLSRRQLVGLEVQERLLRAQQAERQQAERQSGQPQRSAILQLALEQFFDRFEAALIARLWAQPATQLRGLALIPAASSRPQRRLPRPPAYHDCQLTDSGRLIYT
jgi:hypothetical protein